MKQWIFGASVTFNIVAASQMDTLGIRQSRATSVCILDVNAKSRRSRRNSIQCARCVFTIYFGNYRHILRSSMLISAYALVCHCARTDICDSALFLLAKLHFLFLIRHRLNGNAVYPTNWIKAVESFDAISPGMSFFLTNWLLLYHFYRKLYAI